MPGKDRVEEGKEREGHEGTYGPSGAKEASRDLSRHAATDGAFREPVYGVAEVARASIGLEIRDLSSSPGSAPSWLPGHFFSCEMDVVKHAQKMESPSCRHLSLRLPKGGRWWQEGWEQELPWGPSPGLP